MAFVDKTLKCRDCEQDFVFTAGEQEFYAEKVSSTSHSDVRFAGACASKQRAS